MFSVIIPAFNAEKFINNSIQSVLKQTITDFEIVIVDDGSTDCTGEIVKSIDDQRIRYIKQENAGVSVARNTGIKVSKGEFVCFLDADDLWYADHLETLSKMIEEYPQCGVYLTGCAILDNAENIEETTKKILSSFNEESIFSDNVIAIIQKYGYFFNTNSVCCRKSVFDKVGYFVPGIRNGEDDDMWYRIFVYFSAAITKHTTNLYRRNNSGATNQRYFVEDWIFEKRVPEILNDPEVRSEVKRSLKERIETRKLSYMHYLLAIGEKKKAIEIYKTLNKQLVNRNYLILLHVVCWYLKNSRWQLSISKKGIIMLNI